MSKLLVHGHARPAAKQPRHPNRWYSAPLRLILAVLGTAAPAAAQSPPAPDRPAGAAAPAPVEFAPYLDTRAGFALRAPDTWALERQAFPGPGGSQGVLRGGTLADKSTLQVYLFRDAPADPFQGWLQAFAASLERIGGVEQLQVADNPGQARPSGWISVRARVGGGFVRSWYYCVAFDSSFVWVLHVARPDDSEDLSPAGRPAVVSEIADSLEVLYDPARAAELSAAVERGTAFLAAGGLREGIGKLRVDQEPRFYLIEQGGRAAGYLERRYARAQHSLDDPRYGRADKDGLRVSERVWRFEPDGRALFWSYELFSSVDGQTDLYEVTHGETPPTAATGRRARLVRDEVVRQENRLLVSVRTSEDLILPPPRAPLKLDPLFVGLAWQRVFHVFAGQQAGDALGFETYDPDSRALSTRTIQPLGPVASEEAEPHQAYSVRDGYSAAAARLTTDARGHMLRLEVGDVVFRLSTADDVEERFATRREAAFRLLNDVQR